jgi:hypothetical protein
MPRTTHFYIPHIGNKRNTLRGTGTGTVLLDGGLGGQSSYYGVDQYIHSTGRDPRTSKDELVGTGLADKISNKLRNLNIAPPTHKQKRKNISF